MATDDAAPVWGVDTEWGFRDGRHDEEAAFVPVVFCVTRWGSTERHSFWADDPQLGTFFAARRDDLFIAHNAIAEMKYLLRRGVVVPAKWFDTFVASRHSTNEPGIPEAGLSASLLRLGLPHITSEAKDELRQRILNLEFDPDNPANREEITNYCFSDCVGCLALFERLRNMVDPSTMRHWTEYLKAVARMELRGIPIDRSAMNQIDCQTPQIRRRLITDLNRTWPVYEGEKFSRKSFLKWTQREQINWPVKKSETTGKPYRPVDDETLKDMEGRHPFIGEVRQVIKTLGQCGRRNLVVDADTCRHYFSTSVFRSVTGRNQPRQFIFSAPKWFRFLIVPESQEHVLVYVDYVAQEIGIAAALSDDRNLRAVYEASDSHVEFAIRAGGAPPGATKQSHPQIRKIYKTVNLGVLFG